MYGICRQRTIIIFVCERKKEFFSAPPFIRKANIFRINENECIIKTRFYLRISRLYYPTQQHFSFSFFKFVSCTLTYNLESFCADYFDSPSIDENGCNKNFSRIYYSVWNIISIIVVGGSDCTSRPISVYWNFVRFV